MRSWTLPLGGKFHLHAHIGLHSGASLMGGAGAGYTTETGQGLRIAIISDVHCDVPALQRALKEVQSADLVLCAGDLVLQYRFSDEVVDIMRQWRIACVAGNHEAAILSSAGAPLRASGTIRPDNLDYLENLPSLLEREIDGKRIVMMHTSPLDPTGGGRELRDDLAPDRAVGQPDGHTNHLPESNADVLIVGHTHLPVVSKVGKTLLINPGSLGQPRNPDHPHLRTYAILDTITWQASIESFHQSPGG